MQGVTVFFTVTEGGGPVSEPTLGSSGTAQTTDAAGLATDDLTTTYDPGDPERTVLVTATTSNGVSASVDVVINLGI
jgi:hypothetical protein